MNERFDSSEKRHLLRASLPFQSAFIHRSDPVFVHQILWRWIVGVLMRADCSRTENMWVPRRRNGRAPGDQGTITYATKERLDCRLPVGPHMLFTNKFHSKTSKHRKSFGALARPAMARSTDDVEVHHLIPPVEVLINS